MAALDFPSASSSPWVAPNGVIYTYIGTSPNGYWEANTANASQNLTNLFVVKTGSTMSGALKLNNGRNASNPDIAFDGDANTGLYSPVANSLAITTAGTQQLTVDSSGNVGIGTTSADANLHIKGSYPTVHIERDHATNYSRLLLDNTSNDGGSIDGIGDGVGGLRISTSAAGTITERMRIDSSGNVGIGTTSPLTNLDIAPASASASLRVHARSNSSAVSAIELVRGTNTTFGADIYQDFRIKNSAGELIVEHGQSGTTSEALRIDSLGRVGIGTSSPDVALMVEDDSGVKIHAKSQNTTAVLELAGTRYLNAAPVAISRIKSIPENPTGNSDDTSLAFETRSQANGIVEAMRIDSSGNLKLQHTGKLLLTEGANDAFSISTNGANGHFLIRDEYNNSDRMLINNSGRVGVGLTNPVARLDVIGNSGAYPGTAPKKYIYANGGSIRTIGTESSVDIISQALGNHASSLLLRGGNVGYGFVNDSDNDSLDLKSFTANSDDFYIHGNSGGSGLSAHTSIASFTKVGRVGIGTTSPSRLLTVQGDMNLLSGSNIESDSSGGTLRIQGGSTYPGGCILMGGGTGTNDIRFSTTGQSTSVSSTERMRILSSGGLTFNGDTAQANALDDYEEGTFTPNLTFGGSNTNMGFAANTGGSYTKIGRLVYVHIRVELTNKGSSTGGAAITNMPFNAGNIQSGTSSIEASQAIGGYQHLSFISSSPSQVTAAARMSANTNDLELVFNNFSSGTQTSMSHSAFQSSSSFAIDFVYQV